MSSTFTRTSALRKSIIAAALVAIAGCATTPGAPTETALIVPQNDNLNATLWMQQSVEYKATAQSLFALARLRLDEALKDKSWTAVPDKQPKDYKKLPLAVIVDCDETVIDNSTFEGAAIKDGLEYTEELWTQYANSASAGAIPGAVAFANYAASKGVTIFYVTNRTFDTEEATRENLKALGFPLGNSDTIYTKGERPEWTSKKESRIAAVAETHRVVLLMGDNFGDFLDAASGSVADRQAAYEAASEHWGRDWIAMPNPTYGSWEGAAGGPYSLSEDERRQNKINALKAWTPDE